MLLAALGSVRIGKKMLRPRAAFSRLRSQFFPLYGPTLSRPITFLSFSSCRKLAYKWVCLRNFAIESAYAPLAKKCNERTSE